MIPRCRWQTDLPNPLLSTAVRYSGTSELNGEKLFRFRCQTHGHHHHFICEKCGSTKEIDMCPMDFFQNQLEGCEIHSHRFEIFGLCEKCATKV